MEITLSFLLQAFSALLMIMIGYVLNGVRTDMEGFRAQLKTLNDAVLGKYLTREESEQRWESHKAETTKLFDIQRETNHDLRNDIGALKMSLATVDARRDMRP